MLLPSQTLRALALPLLTAQVIWRSGSLAKLALNTKAAGTVRVPFFRAGSYRVSLSTVGYLPAIHNLDKLFTLCWLQRSNPYEDFISCHRREAAPIIR